MIKDAINLSNNTGTITFEEISLYTSVADGIFADGGALNVASGSVVSSAGVAIDIDYTLININLTVIFSSNSPIQGIDLTNLAAGSVINVSEKTTIDNAVDKGIRIDTIVPGGDIHFTEVEGASRNETGVLTKDVQGRVYYGHTTIPNPNGIFAGNFAPRGWAFCNGQLLPIFQNTAMFSLIGTTYGGDGRTTTVLPTLQGRAPIRPGRGPGLADRMLG